MGYNIRVVQQGRGIIFLTNQRLGGQSLISQSKGSNFGGHWACEKVPCSCRLPASVFTMINKSNQCGLNIDGYFIFLNRYRERGSSRLFNITHRILLEGKIEGKRSRGRPRIQWIYDIKKWTTLHYRKAIRTAQDREKLRSVSPNPRPVDGTWTTRR